MACHDAHIALSRDKNDNTNTYEIVIGSWLNRQSVIRGCKQCHHMHTAANQNYPLDCSQYRPFWVSWTDNVIKVGTGHDVSINRFLFWNVTSSPHAVNYLAVATGFGSTGTWKFEISTNALRDDMFQTLMNGNFIIDILSNFSQGFDEFSIVLFFLTRFLYTWPVLVRGFRFSTRTAMDVASGPDDV